MPCRNNSPESRSLLQAMGFTSRSSMPTLYLPSLLEGVFGSERWMASRMGMRGGKSRSEAKTLAARENGKKGGRRKRKEEVAAVQ